jgi:hypothetical protein
VPKLELGILGSELAFALAAGDWFLSSILVTVIGDDAGRLLLHRREARLAKTVEAEDRERALQ